MNFSMNKITICKYSINMCHTTKRNAEIVSQALSNILCNIVAKFMFGALLNFFSAITIQFYSS